MAYNLRITVERVFRSEPKTSDLVSYGFCLVLVLLCQDDLSPFLMESSKTALGFGFSQLSGLGEASQWAQLHFSWEAMFIHEAWH